MSCAEATAPERTGDTKSRLARGEPSHARCGRGGPGDRAGTHEARQFPGSSLVGGGEVDGALMASPGESLIGPDSPSAL